MKINGQNMDNFNAESHEDTHEGQGHRMYKFGFVVVVFLVLSLFSGIVAANQAPSAVLSASPTTVVEGGIVTFDGSGSSDSDGYIVEYKYQYGDGNSSEWLTDSTNSWSYPVAGTYDARLRVKDDGNAMSSWSSTVAITVTVNQAPTAVLSASPTTVVEGGIVTFDGSGSSDSDGSISSYWYDYGNGSDSGWVADTTHSFSYSTAGTYSAKLKVKDNDGAESGWSSTVTITVTVRPSIILLANSIDFSLASDLIEFFNNNGWEVIHATNADFDQYKNQKFIVILGGPDAYEGVGNITQRCLSDSQEEFLRSKGNRKMSVKTNVWSQQGQMVFIIAGSDRHETRSAHLANRGDIINRLP